MKNSLCIYHLLATEQIYFCGKKPRCLTELSCVLGSNWPRVPAEYSFSWALCSLSGLARVAIYLISFQNRKQPDCPRKTIITPEVPFHFDQTHLPVASGGSSARKAESLILTKWTSFSPPVYSAFLPYRWFGVMLFLCHLRPRKAQTAEPRPRCPLHELRKQGANTFNSKALKL